MLDKTDMALIIHTAEDEAGDGSLRARENVVHEAGLFQGRHGFRRAIVLLEEGCNEYSNIRGLSQSGSPGRISRASLWKFSRLSSGSSRSVRHLVGDGFSDPTVGRIGALDPPSGWHGARNPSAHPGALVARTLARTGLEPAKETTDG